MIYISSNPVDTKWMYSLFDEVKFFADHRVKKYKGFSFYEDLCQEAYLGLWTSIKTFDYNKDFDFYRWAQWNISSKIRNFLYENKRSREAASDMKKKMNFECLGEAQTNKILFDEIILNNNFLNKNEKKILIDSFVLNKTLLEISKDLSLSPEGVRKIKNRTILKLKQHI